MIKRNLLFKIAFGFFAVSFCSVIAAIIVHFVDGDSSDAAVTLAAVSITAALAGILLACISKEKTEIEVESDEK